MDEDKSSLRRYSLGIVTVNKEDGSDYIKVTPIELLSFENGPLSDNKRDYEVKGSDIKGVERQSSVEGENTVVAKWIPDGNDNRITAPDVIAGETVQLYKYADSEEIYWKTLFREPELRRLETVHYAYSNMRSGLTPFNKETSYWVEISTKEKHIKIHTSKNDGEACEYDISIDTERGILRIQDDLGNFLNLDSPNGNLTGEINNLIHLKSNRILFEAEDITLKASKVTNDTPMVENTGEETTAGASYANPHFRYAP